MPEGRQECWLTSQDNTTPRHGLECMRAAWRDSSARTSCASATPVLSLCLRGQRARAIDLAGTSTVLPVLKVTWIGASPALYAR